MYKKHIVKEIMRMLRETSDTELIDLIYILLLKSREESPDSLPLLDGERT